MTAWELCQLGRPAESPGNDFFVFNISSCNMYQFRTAETRKWVPPASQLDPRSADLFFTGATTGGTVSRRCTVQASSDDTRSGATDQVSSLPP